MATATDNPRREQDLPDRAEFLLCKTRPFQAGIADFRVTGAFFGSQDGMMTRKIGENVL